MVAGLLLCMNHVHVTVLHKVKLCFWRVFGVHVHVMWCPHEVSKFADKAEAERTVSNLDHVATYRLVGAQRVSCISSLKRYVKRFFLLLMSYLCSGVMSSVSVMFRRAPLCASSLTASMWPLSAAKWRGVKSNTWTTKNKQEINEKQTSTQIGIQPRLHILDVSHINN